MEPRHELAVPLVADIVRIYETETAGKLARRVRCDGRPRVARGGVWQREPVEDIEELCANLEGHLLLERKAAAEVQALPQLMLPAIVVVEAGGGSKLP